MKYDLLKEKYKSIVEENLKHSKAENRKKQLNLHDITDADSTSLETNIKTNEDQMNKVIFLEKKLTEANKQILHYKELNE